MSEEELSLRLHQIRLAQRLVALDEGARAAVLSSVGQTQAMAQPQSAPDAVSDSPRLADQLRVLAAEELAQVLRDAGLAASGKAILP